MSRTDGADRATPSRVLITGGAGRLGRFVADEVAEHHEVLIGDLEKNPDHSSIVFDVLDLDAVRNAMLDVDAVIHLAALDYDTHARPEDFIRVNTMGTWNVLQAAAEAGVRRFVLCSSVAASGLHEMRPGWSPQRLPVDETHSSKPVEAYSVSKAVVETMAQSFIDAGTLDVIALRPCAVVFPENLHSFLAPDAAGQRQLFDYVTAEDAARAFRLAVSSTYQGIGPYLICADDTSNPEPTVSWYRRIVGELPSHLDNSYGALDRTSIFSSAAATRDLHWAPSSEFTAILSATTSKDH